MQAVQFTGRNLDEIHDFVGRSHVLDSFNRAIVVDHGGSRFTWLDAGDWIIQGKGPGWDFYIIKGEKMRELWIPREG